MSVSNWTTIKSIIQGDISYSLRKSLVTNSYVDLDLIAMSEKWQSFDMAFEYRLSSKDEWRMDASITATSGEYLRDNKILGMSSSQYGITNSIRWKYSDNNILYSDSPEVRIRILPRIKVFSEANTNYMISSVYGDSLVEFNSQSEHKCVNINNSGQYICLNAISIYIMDSLDDIAAVYSYSGLLNPTYAMQINSGRYIVSDTDNNRILELAEDLTVITKNVAVIDPNAFDYSEENETLIASSGSGNLIEEFTWSDMDYGTSLWVSSATLNDPQAVTYKQNNVDFIVISDFGNNRVVTCNRLTDTYSYLAHYRQSNIDSGPFEISNFSNPYRVYWLSDGNIIVVEKEGLSLDFDAIVSSSSSSSESSSVDNASPPGIRKYLSYP